MIASLYFVLLSKFRDLTSLAIPGLEEKEDHENTKVRNHEKILSQMTVKQRNRHGLSAASYGALEMPGDQSGVFRQIHSARGQHSRQTARRHYYHKNTSKKSIVHENLLKLEVVSWFADPSCAGLLTLHWRPTEGLLFAFRPVRGQRANDDPILNPSCDAHEPTVPDWSLLVFRHPKRISSFHVFSF